MAAQQAARGRSRTVGGTKGLDSTESSDASSWYRAPASGQAASAKAQRRLSVPTVAATAAACTHSSALNWRPLVSGDNSSQGVEDANIW